MSLVEPQTWREPVAAEVMRRIDVLAEVSETTGALTRRYLTPEHRRANDLVARWMAEAGMTARQDQAGNIIGRYDGIDDAAPCLMIGSHLDTVVNAGRFDGMLGVLSGIACVQILADTGRRMRYPIEVVGFADEEGVRFGTTYLGSQAIAGTLDPAKLSYRDAGGVSFRQALIDFGLDPDRIGEAARDWAKVRAFLELHIEQGPVLEALGRPVGVVTAINGQTRLAVTLSGEAGHAGTVPMSMRRDAMAAAAESVLAVETICGRQDGLVGTVGVLEIADAAINVVPGKVDFTVDLRAPGDAARASAVAAVTQAIQNAGQKRQVEARVSVIHEAASTACSQKMITVIEKAIAATGITPTQIPSGAGHDAAAMAGMCDVGMIFLRCDGGISHNPAERASQADVAAGIAVILRVLDALEA